MWFDKKYIGIVSPHLRNFKWVDSNTANFSCPICGDSTKNQKRARGYLYCKQGSKWMYKCHNCSCCMSIAKFFKQCFPWVENDYLFEKIKNSNTLVSEEYSIPEPVELNETLKSDYEWPGITPILDLPKSHIVWKYVLKRKLPPQHYDNLFFTEKWSVIRNFVKGVDDSVEFGHPRLIIAFRDKNKKIVALQGRDISGKADNAIKYLTATKAETLTYGLDKLDIHAPNIFVTEGPIDSMFLPNAIAVCNSVLLNGFTRQPSIKDQLILISDNQPEHRVVTREIAKYIKAGFRVMIWPSHIKFKDINECVMEGITDIETLVLSNTFSGLRAELEFSKWKKI